MICLLLLSLLFIVWVRIMYVLCSIHKGTKTAIPKRVCPLSTAIIIGSGGHTTEILMLLRNLNPANYSPRTYIMASTDTSSETKIHQIEETCLSCMTDCYEIVKIPRSRRVGQLYITSIFTTLFALFVTFPVMLKKRPELIICNGPGTCIPVCVVAFMMRVLCISNTKIMFVESICRVKTLSLSGKILLLLLTKFLCSGQSYRSFTKELHTLED